MFFFNVLRKMFVMFGTRISRYNMALVVRNAVGDSGPRTITVCLSPACLSDGAENIFEKIQALSPSRLQLKSGSCCSLCGNGPIVVDILTSKKWRKMNEEKIIEILFGDEPLDHRRAVVLESVNTVMEAERKINSKDYDLALGLLEEAISSGEQSALQLHQEKCQVDLEDESAPGLQWLIKAMKMETVTKMKIGDLDGALIAATLVCRMTDNRSQECLELLHESSALKGDTKGELRALRLLFDLQEPAKSTNNEMNNRRRLKFRLHKLESDLQ